MLLETPVVESLRSYLETGKEPPPTRLDLEWDAMQAIAVRVSILVALLTLVACVVRSIVRAGSWQGTLSTTAVLWEPVMCVK